MTIEAKALEIYDDTDPSIHFSTPEGEILRLSIDGAWVRGEKVESNGEVWVAFKEFLAQATAYANAYPLAANAREAELMQLRTWRAEAVKVMERAEELLGDSEPLFNASNAHRDAWICQRDAVLAELSRVSAEGILRTRGERF